MRDATFDERQTIVRRPREDEVTVGVDVDEAGCDDFAGRVDHGVGPVDLETLSRVDSDDASVVDGDIGASFGGAGAVDDATVTNESVDVQRESPLFGSPRGPGGRG